MKALNNPFHQLQTVADGTKLDPHFLYSGLHHHQWEVNNSTIQTWFATDQVNRLNKDYQGARFDYVFNEHGYRCDELKESDILTIGCSYTFGVGLPAEQTWAHKLATVYDVPYINLAWPGAGTSYMLRTLSKTIKKVNPQCVIALIPYNHRFELISESGATLTYTKSSGMSHLFEKSDKERIYAYETYTTQTQEDYELLRNVQAMAAICEAMGASFMWSTWTYEEPRSEYFEEHCRSIGHYVPTTIFDGHIRWKDLDKKARDSTHPGPEYHTQYAKQLQALV